MPRRHRFATALLPAEAPAAPEMNVTPLVDVVLVLLIICMVVAPTMEQGTPVVLPSVSRADGDTTVQPDPIRVTIPRAGEYHLESDPLDIDGLVTRLNDAHASDPLRRLVLRADENLTYGDVRPLLDRIQAIGFPGFSFTVSEQPRRDRHD